jgi:uncharacterized cupin superfamily protein
MPKTIEVQKNPPESLLAEMRVRSWPIWEKEVSKFPYTYDENETCLFLEGEVVVTPDGGAPVSIGAGDLVVFPDGLSCTWDIRKNVRKHYKFG